MQRDLGLPEGYTKVAVLLVKWAHELDELNTKEEAEGLEKVFRKQFHYETKIVELDLSSKPQLQLNLHLTEFVAKHDGPNNLLIVYYTGHGVFRDDHKHLDFMASLTKTPERGLNKVPKCNWNAAEDILRSDYVECDVLTILDTCYASNLAKSGNEEGRVMELLSACAIDQTTSSGDNSFTRALIDALKQLLGENVDRAFSTHELNQLILRDIRRLDTPSQLWYRSQYTDRHILLAPLKLQEKPPSLPQLPRSYLTLRFALRQEMLGRVEIEYLTSSLAKAFHKKAPVGLRRVDWVGIKPARITPFERAALATYVIKKWRNIVKKEREQRLSEAKVDEVRLPIEKMGVDSPTPSPSPSPTKKRSRNGLEDVLEPERKRGNLGIQPPSPPVSIFSPMED
ncbi:hypothetical protein P280DRAFT_474521, partial [Massarina eburnea CBS 473.64]